MKLSERQDVEQTEPQSNTPPYAQMPHDVLMRARLSDGAVRCYTPLSMPTCAIRTFVGRRKGYSLASKAACRFGRCGGASRS
jgi:hypothetical protein